MNRQPVFARITCSIALVLILAVLLITPLLAAPASQGSAGAAIAGEVFMDGNTNRIREPLEAGIPNARVVLRNVSSRAVVEEVTDVDGYYVFGDLEIGTYEVEVIPPSGYIVITNGTLVVQLAEVGAPLSISTSLRFGIFLPQLSR